jgi:outer membrane protein assembly factor BamB
MKNHRKYKYIGMYGSCIIFLLLIMALVPSAAAVDTMFRANAQHTGVYDNGGIVPTNTELWRFQTGGAVDSSPAVANGVVYVGSDDYNLYAIDALTGKEKWRFKTGDVVDSSPAVANGVVYVGSDDYNLYAIDTLTGKEKWRFRIGTVVDSSPAVANGVVYVGSSHDYYDSLYALYAIDAATGKEKWRFQIGGPVSSSPAVSNGIVYVGSQKQEDSTGIKYIGLYAIDAVTGKEKWHFKILSDVSSSPAVSNGIVYVGCGEYPSSDHGVYAIDAVTGKELWRFQTINYVKSSPAVASGVVYIGCDDYNLYAIDAVTGKEKWRFKTGGVVDSSPAVANGVVYVGSGYNDNNLYAIDGVTGKEKWRFKTGGVVDSSPAVANGVVYVGSDDKNLYAIGGASSTPKTTLTTASTTASTAVSIPQTQNAPLSSSSSSSGDSNGYLPIILILVVLCIVGGGYAFYRMKNKPTDGQPPEGNGIPAIPSPPPTTRPSSEERYPASSDNLLDRIASVEQKAASLSRFKSPVQALIAKSREQYRSGEYDAVSTTLKSAEDSIPSLARCETQLKQWNTEGYTTTPLESLKTDNINTITTVFQDFEKDLATLEQLGRRVEDLKRLNSSENIDSSIDQRITAIGPQIKDPRNIPGIKREIDAIEQVLRDQQERSRQLKDTEQLLIRLKAKAGKLTRYAQLVTGSLKAAEAQNTNGQFEEARKTLNSVEGTINTLLECESSLASWKAKGYDTTGLETLQPENSGEVITAFKQYDQTVNRLETIEQELASKKKLYPQLMEQPGTASIVLAIEHNLNDPARIETVEKDYQQLESAIRQWEDLQKSTEQNIRDQAERVERESSSPVVKRETTSIMKCIRQGDIPRAQEMLQGLAEQQLSQVNTALGALRADGAVVAVSSESISQQIAGQHYSDAIIDSEKAIAELTRVQEIYAKAKVLRPTVTGPVILALYNNGKYEEFIRASEEQQRLDRKVTELKEKGRTLLVDAEKFGMVPEHVRSQLGAQDIPTIQSAITELEAFSTTAKPELVLSLDRTQLSAEKWHKVEIQISNTGNAHASHVNLSFSDDFDTRWIEPTSVEAGKKAIITSGIFPKMEGNIPLEISCSYRDLHNKEYQQKFRFWIDVVEKGSTTTSGAHSTPPGQFTPGPATLKQLPPDLSDRYTESEFIGKGGFARVFKAKRKDGKIVAVKIPLSLDAITGKSFIAEMQNWTKLSHTNIVKLYDFNIMPLPYFEEELCDSSLADQKKPIENEEAAWILFNICEGLKFAHGQKIIHRDLKPHNILLKNGVPKISDWGLSKILSGSTSTTSTSFTPFYAAPEQIQNRAKDERTDIWQLGVILYELVTGTLPFKGESMFEIGMNIATKDPQGPGEIKPESKMIESVVMKCLQKEPERRYQSVLELQKDLAMFLRQNYADLLSTSVTAQDYSKSAYFCGDLVMISMVTGDIATAYKYLLDLVQYSKGDVKADAQELSEQLKMRMEMGVTEIPEELIHKADLIIHQVSTGFRKKG